MSNIAALLARILNGVINAYNQYKKRKAESSPADTIANGGDVVQSDQSYSDLANKHGSNRTK